MVIHMLEDVLKAARTRLNLKQSEVADLVGVTTQTYLKWENGRSEPKVSQVGKLAKVLHVTERELCQGELFERKIEPLEFVRRVGILMSHVPETEMLIGMHQYISDPESFIQMLTKVSDYPYELIEQEEREAKRVNAQIIQRIIAEKGVEAFSSEEEMEQAKQFVAKVLQG